MNKFHTTVSRRTFMKALGIGIGATGAAAVTMPAFQDIDDMLTSTPQKQHPWWVKERDYDDITTEVDWDMFKAYDPRVDSASALTTEYSDIYHDNIAQRDARRAANKPGFSIKDRALNVFSGTTFPGVTISAANPVEEGVKWSVSPEENFQVLQAALHWFGSDSVGALNLSDKTKKLFANSTTFNAADGEGTASNKPANAKNILVFAVCQNYNQKRFEFIESETNIVDGMTKAGIPTDLGRTSVYRAYTDAQLCEWQFVKFITGLGWYYGTNNQNNDGPNIPYGIFGGLGELSRTTHLMTPSRGIMPRRTNCILTDMPIAPKKPLDFGGTKFCKTCRRCAEKCPSGAMYGDDYKETTYDVDGYAQRPGYSGWRVDWRKCKSVGAPGNCGVCHGLCPFNHQSEALIHPMVRMVSAQTTLFNGFFGTMDRFMNYAKPQTDTSLEAWWKRDLKADMSDTIYGSGRYKWNF